MDDFGVQEPFAVMEKNEDEGVDNDKPTDDLIELLALMEKDEAESNVQTDDTDKPDDLVHRSGKIDSDKASEDLNTMIALMDEEDEVFESDQPLDDTDEPLTHRADKVENDKQTDVAESNLLEKEYLELEKKLREIKEKMKKNSQTSTITQTTPSIKDLKRSPESASSEIVGTGVIKQTSLSASGNLANSHKNQKLSNIEHENVRPECSGAIKKPQQSPFLAAFGHLSKEEALSSKAGTSTSKSLEPKRDRDNKQNDPPPQKKRRLAHSSDISTPSLPVDKPGNTNFYSKSSDSASNRNSTNTQSKKATPNCVRPQNVPPDIEYHSQISLRKRFVPNSEMKNRMDGKLFLHISQIRTSMKISEDRDWVTVGCISKQIDRQSSKNGKTFSILNLTDLKDCTKIVSLFLFGNVHAKLSQQVAVGSVIGILNPTIMPPKTEDSTTPALTVDVAERVMHIGLASDLGWCTAIKYRNKQPAGKCLAVINKKYSDVCEFHLRFKYKKASGKRSELQGSHAPVPKKFQKFQNVPKNDHFFYGGKLYSTNPTPKVTKNGPQGKIKLSKFMADHSDLAAEARKEIMEKSKVMNALGGIKGQHEVSGCSDTFATMLASGDNVAGSRQFLNHLNNVNQKEEDKTAKRKPETPAEFLKQKGNVAKLKTQEAAKSSPKTASIQSRIKPNNGPSTSATSTRYITANDIKKATADMIQARKIQKFGALSKSQLPQLGRGLSNGDFNLFEDEDEENLPPANADFKKRQAIAKLSNNAGNVAIQKVDPNRGVLQKARIVRDNQSLQSRIREKVNKNIGRLDKKDKNAVAEPPKSRFGRFTEAEVDELLNTKSIHWKDVEASKLDEQEQYFTPLIRKEMMEKKMSETFEITCKVVSCIDCDYTFWCPHDKCKENRHRLNWSAAKKRFFECSNCKCRVMTWKTYPTKACRKCGSSKNWHHTSMLKEKDAKVLDSDVLLIRGLEHGKFLNSLN